MNKILIASIAALLFNANSHAAPTIDSLLLQAIQNNPPQGQALQFKNAQGKIVQPLYPAQQKVMARAAKKTAAYVEGEVLVTFKKTASALQAQAATSQLGMQQAKSYTHLNKKLNGKRVALLKTTRKESTAQMLAKLATDATVAAVSPNYIITADAVNGCAGITPNDTYFSQQWGFCNWGQTGGTSGVDIQATEAWQLHNDSSPAIVAVIDTGVAYTHNDLIDNMWRNSAELNGVVGVDDDNNGYIDDIYGIDAVNHDSDPFDDHYHGTHVAGTISAKTNNAKGVSGVNWNAQIMAIKFLSTNGNGTTEGVLESINYAVNMKGKGHNIVAINASYGCASCFSQPEKDAIDAAGTAGILFVAASGNNGSNSDGGTHHYPADYTSSNLIAVAATDHNDALAGFSNYGVTSVDLGAPGVGILSTMPPTLTSFTANSTLYSNNIETVTLSPTCSASNWCSYGYDVTNPASPIAITGTWAANNEAAYSATQSLSDSPSGNYLDKRQQFIKSPAIDLHTSTGDIAVSFRAQINLENNFDYLYIYVCSVALSQCEWEGYATGEYSSSWLNAKVVIRSSTLRRAADAQLAFAVISDDAINKDGVHIDDITIQQGTAIYTDNYTSKNGTSMATPHVTGAAAFVATAYPTENVTSLKARLLNTGDSIPALAGKTTTGKRLNLYRALTPVDLKLTATASSVKPLIGHTVDLIVRINNNGISDASNIIVQNTLPANFSYVSDNGSGNYNSTNGQWTIATLAAGATSQLRITATASTSTVGNYSAEIIAQYQLDTNSIPNNHNPLEDDQAAVTIKPQARVVAANSCRGDFDNDGDVDDVDKTVFLAAFRSTTALPAYNANADFDSDGDVDNADFSLFRSDYGRTDCLTAP